MSAEVEVEEVDDVAVDNAVGDVAEDTRKNEGAGQAGELVGGFAVKEHNHDNSHDESEKDVEIEPSTHQSKGGAGIGDVDQTEEAGNDGDFVVQGDEGQSGPLRQLIEDEERERDEKKEAKRVHGEGSFQCSVGRVQPEQSGGVPVAATGLPLRRSGRREWGVRGFGRRTHGAASSVRIWGRWFW